MEKPLWFVTYDPARTDVKTMRHCSKMFKRLKDAMAYAKNGTMNHGYSFHHYAVIRYGIESNKTIVTGTIDFE